MISYKEFRRIYTDAFDCKDYDNFVSEVFGSIQLDDADAVMCILKYVWGYAHTENPLRWIREQTDFSQIGFSEHYDLPRRSIESWETELRNAPPYTKNMLAYCVLTDILDNAI